jgi:hypothetical protein
MARSPFAIEAAKPLEQKMPVMIEMKAPWEALFCGNSDDVWEKFWKISGKVSLR